MSNGDTSGIQLGQGGGVDPSMAMMGGGGGDTPGLSMTSDDPQMDQAPEQGSATIQFHKHSHTKERHPDHPGKHRHHVHLKVHSIKFHHHKKPKVSKEELEEALSGAPPDNEAAEGEPPPQ